MAERLRRARRSGRQGAAEIAEALSHVPGSPGRAVPGGVHGFRDGAGRSLGGARGTARRLRVVVASETCEQQATGLIHTRQKQLPGTALR